MLVGGGEYKGKATATDEASSNYLSGGVPIKRSVVAFCCLYSSPLLVETTVSTLEDSKGKGFRCCRFVVTVLQSSWRKDLNASP